MKLRELLLRPQLNFDLLRRCIVPLDELILSFDDDLRNEAVEAAEILIKYDGYIERERQIARKLQRLDNLRLPRDFDYSGLKSISTEARQKLQKHKPETIGEASRIPGISPSDVNILLLLMNR